MKQEKENRIVEYVKRFFYIMGGVAIGMTLATLLSGCAPRVITVPEYHTEYVTRTDTFVSRDSIHVHDSIYVTLKGDTVNVERWHTIYKDRWREKILTDTVIKTDSVAVQYPVEKKLTRWQQAKLDLGGWMVGVILVSFIFFCIYLARGKVFRGK